MIKEEKLSTIHSVAVKNIDRFQSVMRDERMQCLQDRRFVSIAGAQWEGSLLEQFENKPRLEMDKISLALTRIFSEYRNNKVDVTFISTSGKETDELADICAGLHRSDEQDSQAEEAYDNCFDEGTSGGFGAWRLKTEYEDEEDDENDHQRIRFEPIYDADTSVFFDLNAKRYDKSDARWCAVMVAMTPDAYKEEFDRDPASMQKLIHQRYFDWFSPEVIYIAEYYEIEEKTETIHIFEGINGEVERYNDKQLNEDTLSELESRGFNEVRTRKIKRKRVHKYILDGVDVIEDCGIIAGKYIPIIPYYGKRFFIDNVERCIGHVRKSKDAQRLKNMQLSKLAEISALSSYEKPIFTPEQVMGHEDRWAKDNVDNYPYQLVNPITDANGNLTNAGAVDFVRPPTVPPALAALVQSSDVDMNDILGNQQAGEQVVSAMSGKAVELVQNRLDMQSFIYISNFAKSKKHSGRVWLSMAKDILVEDGRKMKTVGVAEEVDYIELVQPTINEKTGVLEYKNDLTNADFDVAVNIGPSSSSKRASTVRELTGMMQLTEDPQDRKVLSSFAMMNMEGEGISEVRAYYRNQLLHMGVIKPTKQEQEELMAEMQNKQPDPQSQYLQAAAQEAQAKSIKAQADTELAMAKAEETRASTLETITNLSREGRMHVIETAQKLNEITQGNEVPQ